MNDLSSGIIKRITNALNEGEIDFSFDEETSAFFFDFPSDTGMKSITCAIPVFDTYFTVMAYLPMKFNPGDPAETARISEFIAKANCFTDLAYLNMCFADGTIASKQKLDCRFAAPVNDAVLKTVFSTIAVLEHFGEDLIDVISGKQNIDDVLTKVEDKIHNADFLLLLQNGDLDSPKDDGNEESFTDELGKSIENINRVCWSMDELK